MDKVEIRTELEKLSSEYFKILIKEDRALAIGPINQYKVVKNTNGGLKFCLL